MAGSSGLGFRVGHDSNAERNSGTAPRLPPPVPAPSSKSRGMTCSVPRGLIPTFVYSGIALILPVLFFYVSYDVTSNVTKGVTVGLASLAALAIVLANDCCCWYNMILFFHIGLEVKVVDIGIAFARAVTTSGDHMGLAITGVTVVIVHLIPFLLTDRLMLLALLAFAGVIVNVSMLVFLEQTSLVILVGASALVLLATTMIIGGVCDIKTSMLSLVRSAFAEQKFITCNGFDL